MWKCGNKNANRLKNKHQETGIIGSRLGGKCQLPWKRKDYDKSEAKFYIEKRLQDNKKLIKNK